MKHAATMALIVTLGVGGVYAQQIPVKMRFSGDGGPSVIDLKQPNANTGEENLTGYGTQGPFTFRLVKASMASPQPSSTCSGATKVYFPNVSGAGLFRFFDGSLLMVNLTDGGDCIDFAANQAQCTLTFQVTGGTGRFKNASGVLTFTETAAPLLSDASSNPVFFSETGQFTGTISVVAMEEGSQDGRQ
ncbi:MAG TPA: hypothetical protein VK776_03730 [Bryobacteraceae bacterium]|nr:hypothetical protein [Bryobacteraceae bacterium]